MYINIFWLFSLMFGLVYLILASLFIISVITVIISLWKIFEKADKTGYYTLIPFYNIWLLVEIAQLKWYYVFIILSNIFLPVFSFGLLSGLSTIVALFGIFSLNYNLAKKFNKDEVLYGIGLTILPVLFYPLLAFSNSEYNSKINVSLYGPIKEETVNNYFNKNNK